MARASVRISSTVRKELDEVLNGRQIKDFILELVEKFNKEIYLTGQDETMIELLKFKTKRKPMLVEDEENAKDLMATFIAEETTYDTFKNHCDELGISVSEAVRRLINREIAITKKLQARN